MNGRVYDPLTARFVSADPYIQSPEDSQSYNRYSYVWNNPTNLTDPTGFEAVERIEVTGEREKSDTVSWFPPGTLSQTKLAIPVLVVVGRVLATPQGKIATRATGVACEAGPYVCALAVAVGAGFVAYEVYQIYDANKQDNSGDKSGDGEALKGSGSSSASPPPDDDDGARDKTKHGQQRADEAKRDSQRSVGDSNRVIREGREFFDNDTGNTVHVNGDRVVITNEQGDVVTQFKNTRANTNARIESGRWTPKN